MDFILCDRVSRDAGEALDEDAVGTEGWCLACEQWGRCSAKVSGFEGCYYLT